MGWRCRFQGSRGARLVLSRLVRPIDIPGCRRSRGPRGGEIGPEFGLPRAEAKLVQVSRQGGDRVAGDTTFFGLVVEGRELRAYFLSEANESRLADNGGHRPVLPWYTLPSTRWYRGGTGNRSVVVSGGHQTTSNVQGERVPPTRALP